MKPEINSIENNVDPDQLASEEPRYSGSRTGFPITSECIIIIEYEIQNFIFNKLSQVS